MLLQEGGERQKQQIEACEVRYGKLEREYNDLSQLQTSQAIKFSSEEKTNAYLKQNTSSIESENLNLRNGHERIRRDAEQQIDTIRTELQEQRERTTRNLSEPQRRVEELEWQLQAEITKTTQANARRVSMETALRSQSNEYVFT